MSLRAHAAGLPARAILGIILVLATSGAAGRTLAQDAPGAAAADPRDRTAVLLFTTRVQQTPVPLDPARIRHACTAGLAEGLRALGHDVVDPAELQPLTMRWRVRGDLAITGDFLRDCRETLGARQLVVAHVLIGPRQITLLCRAVATPWGVLSGVRTAVAGLPSASGGGAEPSESDWLQVLGDLCRTADLPPAPATVWGTRNLVVFPTTPIGCDRATADLATQCLLAFLLENQPLPIMDPGYAAATLLQAGVAPQKLGGGGRALLADRFHAATVMNSELISYTLAGGETAQFAAGGDAESSGTDPLAAFSLTLRETELATGSIVRDSAVFRDHSNPTGWFGRLDEASLADHLAEAVRSLWSALHPEPKES